MTKSDARTAQQFRRDLKKIVEANGGKVITVRIGKKEWARARKELNDFLKKLHKSQRSTKKSKLRVRTLGDINKAVNNFVQRVETAHKLTAKSKRVFRDTIKN